MDSNPPGSIYDASPAEPADGAPACRPVRKGIDKRWLRILDIICLAITVAAFVIGMFVHESDLIFAGIITSLILAVLIFMGEKAGYVRPIYVAPMGILMLLCIAVNTHDGGWWMDILGTVPVYVATSFTIIGLLVGYCGVRLDRVMMGVYIFFTSLSMGGFIGAGFYLYNYNRGLSEEFSQEANYWIGWEYLTVMVASLIITALVYAVMKNRNILLLTSENVLEAEA